MARQRGHVLDVAILGLLHESDLHGYELRKRLNLLFGWGRVLSYGSLYPACKKLLRSGLIAEELADAGRRRKIVYSLTDAGRAWFSEQVTDSGPSSWDDESFDVRFAFFARTDAGVRLRILEGRRTRLEERLERVRGSSHGLLGDSYAAELRRHSIESVERELAWLTTLIHNERGDAERSAAPVAEDQPAPERSTTELPTGEHSPAGGNQS